MGDDKTTASLRSQQARMAANCSWAATRDRSARTAPAREAAYARFEKQVDPDGTMTLANRAKAAEAAYRAHMQRCAIASAKARRAHRPRPAESPATEK